VIALALRLHAFYSEDQPRDPDGKWGSGGSEPSNPALAALGKLAEGDGFTVNPVTGETPTTGFAVAIEGHSGIHTTEEFAKNPEGIIREWRAANADALADPHAMMGGWVSGGKVFLDVVHVHETKEEGIAAGKAADQIAIYNLGTGTEIPTGGTGGVAAALSWWYGEEDPPPREGEAAVGDDAGGGRRAREEDGRRAHGADQEEVVARLRAFYNEDQPRDESGRWGSGGGETKETPSARALALRASGIAVRDAVHGKSQEYRTRIHEARVAAEEQLRSTPEGRGTLATAELWSHGKHVDGLRTEYAVYRETGQAAPSFLAFFETMKAAETDTPLYRGIVMREGFVADLKEGNQYYVNPQDDPGMKLPDTLSSWSRDEGVAKEFTNFARQDDSGVEDQILLTLEPGAPGLDIAALVGEVYAVEQEVIVGGGLQIVDPGGFAQDIDGRYHMTVRAT
jgi:hypothetical protein